MRCSLWCKICEVWCRSLVVSTYAHLLKFKAALGGGLVDHWWLWFCFLFPIFCPWLWSLKKLATCLWSFDIIEKLESVLSEDFLRLFLITNELIIHFDILLNTNGDILLPFIIRKGIDRNFKHILLMTPLNWDKWSKTHA